MIVKKITKRMLKVCLIAAIPMSANALSNEDIYGDYKFSAHESNGIFLDKPLEDYTGTITIKKASYSSDIVANIRVDGGRRSKANVKINYEMISFDYDDTKGRQIMAFCSKINEKAFLNGESISCEGSLSGNANAETTFTLRKVR